MNRFALGEDYNEALDLYRQALAILEKHGITRLAEHVQSFYDLHLRAGDKPRWSFCISPSLTEVACQNSK